MIVHVEKNIRVIGSCAECHLPVYYGAPAYWTMGGTCGHDVFVHQHCLVAIDAKSKQEALEDGLIAEAPTVIH